MDLTDMAQDSVVRTSSVRIFVLAWLAALALSVGLPHDSMRRVHASAQGAERTIFDATIIAIPPVAAATCVLIGNGRVAARARLTGQAAPQPVTLRLTGYQQYVPVVGAALPVGRDEISTTLPVAEGSMCWTVEVSPPVDLRAADAAERSAYAQFVTLTMTFEPD